MLFEYTLSAPQAHFYNITPQVREAVTQSSVISGMAVVFNPHTTAGITINENADPDVIPDLLHGLDSAFPDRAAFRHSEGNSAAHLKASAMGASATLIIDNGKLVLGTWQGIYFCEFDPPRNRKFYVKIMRSE
ncbi:MAG: secondary thiamine-phosphate synthase enzyme YjbQ [Defluviitaleaceae bacterium]|nr:secondary thiamine-phosphate synthase enzyme YjbQ [Defluviitaleaceae bacterium]